ncbi:MAG: ATP-binding protein [Actinomycetota bacterium]|nr:ATP-binding protein [Actinomycetota bacterium]
MHPVEIAIPPGTAYVGIVRLAIASLARAAGFDEERVDEVRIAVSEACTNAVLANESAGSAERISVGWSEEPDRIVVEVGDRGASSGAGEGNALDSQGFSSRLMMSVALIQELVDELSIDGRSGGGTTTRLSFSRAI